MIGWFAVASSPMPSLDVKYARWAAVMQLDQAHFLFENQATPFKIPTYCSSFHLNPDVFLSQFSLNLITTSFNMPTAIPPPEEQAISIIAPRKFHQIFIVPATDKHGRLKVTYAVLGKQDGDDVPTIMFCGGMFGMRWQGIYFDWLAEKEGVRMLIVDR